MNRFSEADFDRVQAQAAFWRELLRSPAWIELERDRKIMIRAWEKSLRTEDPGTIHRTQGMIMGAEVVLGYAGDKVVEIESVLESMKNHNEGLDREEVEDAE
jgi:hypothetical protein